MADKRGVDLVPTIGRNSQNFAAQEAKVFFPIDDANNGAYDGFPDADNSGRNGSLPSDIEKLSPFATGPDIRSTYISPRKGPAGP
jgi:hypothetical protein